MKVMIADDEHLARRRMESLLAQFSDIEIIASLGDADAALKACEDMHPDLLLLDIRMPGLDGLEFARRLRESDARTQIVFCTAYEQHAVDAWEVRASDYLLKPVTPDRLQRALTRVRELIGEGGPARAWLHARVRGETLRIALEEVLYLQAEDKYVTTHLTGGRSILLEDSLKSLHEAHPDRLVRLHRNSLVPRERLLGLRSLADGGAEARIAGCEDRLEVSRRNLPVVRKLLRE